jgi:hypothetical protein
VEPPDHAGYRLARDQVVERVAREQAADGLVRDQVVERRARDQVVERPERRRVTEGPTRDQVVERLARDQVVEFVGTLSQVGLRDHVVDANTAARGVEALSAGRSDARFANRENSVGDAEMSSG